MKFTIACLFLLVSMGALAQSRVVSIDAFDLSYGGGLAFKKDQAKTGSDRTESNFRFNLNFAQSLEQYAGLMWKAQLHANRSNVDYGSADAFESTYGLNGGLLYNFQPEDLKNSFMAGAMIGLERAAIEFGSNDRKEGFNMLFQAEGGKRWDLGQYSVANISYAPTVSFHYKRYGGDIRNEYYTSGSEIRFNFLKFDVLF